MNDEPYSEENDPELQRGLKEVNRGGRIARELWNMSPVWEPVVSPRR